MGNTYICIFSGNNHTKRIKAITFSNLLIKIWGTLICVVWTIKVSPLKSQWRKFDLGDESAFVSDGVGPRARHHALPLHALLRERGCSRQDTQEDQHTGQLERCIKFRGRLAVYSIPYALPNLHYYINSNNRPPNWGRSKSNLILFYL